VTASELIAAAVDAFEIGRGPAGFPPAACPSPALAGMRGLVFVRTEADNREPAIDPAAKAELARLVAELAVVHGRVVLSSGREADYYVDLRRVTLHHAAAPLIGRLLRQLTSDWDYHAVGGLTLGADPVATAMLHAAADGEGFLDACVVRKAGKAHGLQRRIEGPDVEGRAVLVVEDVSTTGGSPLTAAEALQEAGAEVIGVAVIVDRGGREAVEKAGFEYRAAYELAELGLG
jgi:orotate phosphoribosyltransferase